MRNRMKRGLAAALCVCLAAGALAGCGKKEKAADPKAALLTLKDGTTINEGAANLILRYQQAEFENGIGSFIKSYYGDIWNADLMGTGEAYGTTFKEQVLEDLQHMLLAEKHAADYSVELTDDEKKNITQAAKDFLAANDAAVLEKMTADQESVERMLTLYTIRSKVEAAMSADVDTEVSDEEAAQRTVSYVEYYATPETEEETEAVSEAVTESGESTTEEAAAESAVETESEAKTKAAGKSETETAATEEASESASGEEAGEAVAEEAGAGAESELSSEAETETESPEMIEARAEALAKAEAFLAKAKEAENFAEAAQEEQDNDPDAYFSSWTFGKDDTYPDAEIIEITEGLEDDTLIDHVIVVGSSYYVIHMDDAFDEEATKEKKEQIVEDRRSEKINNLYQEWEGASEFTLDTDAWKGLVFDIALTEETEAATEEETGALVVEEAASEGEGVVETATEG